MLAFLASCRDAGQTVQPQTAFAYLSAVKKFFQVNGVDVQFFHNSHYIQNTKAGMLNAYRVMANRDDQDSTRLPISNGMIQEYNGHLRQILPHYGIVQLAVYTAQLLGYTTLSRVSEYLLVPGEAEHLLVSECVLFQMKSGSLIPSCDVSGWDFAQVTGCVIDILSAKNDAEHKGHRMFFGKADLADPTLQAYCITTALWTYTKAVLPIRGQSFFFVPALNWTLKPTYFNNCLKAMAVYFHLDPGPDFFPFFAHWRCVCSCCSWSAGLYHIGYGSLEVPCLSRICASKYTDVRTSSQCVGST
jgi:hypothetical protein